MHAQLLPLRCVTIDVEEYYHIEAGYGRIDRARWNEFPTRAERNVDLLLQLFKEHDQQGTFFILGDVARRRPKMVRRIAEAGHEIASHGMNHDRLHRLDRAAFSEDVSASKKLLEDQTGGSVIGYRAPTFSIVRQTAWAIEALLACGFTYDASVFPVRHPWYGVPDAPLEPFMVRSGGAAILEVPPLVWKMAGRHLPVAGGGYFRLLPLGFMLRGLEQAAREGRPAVLYFHPWEFDPQMPRLPLSWTGRLRTYSGLKKARVRLQRVMCLPGRWRPIAGVLDELRELANRQPIFEL